MSSWITVMRFVQSGNANNSTPQLEVTGEVPTRRCGASVLIPAGLSSGAGRSNLRMSGKRPSMSASKIDSSEEAIFLDSTIAAHPRFPRPNSVSNAL